MVLPTLISVPYAMFAPSYSLFADPLDVTRAVMPLWYDLAESHRRQQDIHRRQFLKLRKTLKESLRLSEQAQSPWTVHDGRTSHWTVNDDHAELDLRLQGVEDGSLAAELSSDGSSIKLSGKSKKECDCQSSGVLAEISLPHGAVSPDDLELVQQGESLLKIRTPLKRAEKPPLELKILKASPAPEGPVAPPRDAKQEEKELDDKFKLTANAKLEDVAAEVSAVHKAKAALQGLTTEETQDKQGAPATDADTVSTSDEASQPASQAS